MNREGRRLFGRYANVSYLRSQIVKKVQSIFSTIMIIAMYLCTVNCFVNYTERNLFRQNNRIKMLKKEQYVIIQNIIQHSSKKNCILWKKYL